jgi:hypothetical protein
VGVNAPGTAKMITFRPFILSANETEWIPSASFNKRVASGRVTPVEISMLIVLSQLRFVM